MTVYMVLPGREVKRNELSDGEILSTISAGVDLSVCTWLSLYDNLAQVHVKLHKIFAYTLLCSL